jgi:hypothetical protein
MNKQEAIKKFVQEMNPIPQEWVQIVAEHNGEYPRLPMWGTMWFPSAFDAEKMWKNSRVMAESKEEIDLDQLEDIERKKVEKAIEEDDWLVLEEYVDEEMAYEHNVLDKDGDTTAVYIYEVGDEYVIGVNGAGWNFYDGVWDKLYDTCGLHWHKGENDETE